MAMAIHKSPSPSTWMYPGALLLLWFVQPWGLRLALLLLSDRRARFVCASLAVTLATVSGYVALQWHASLRLHHLAVPPRTVLFVLFVPVGIQVLRYAHATVWGTTAFARHFGLTPSNDDWQWRLCVFMWCTPTVIFHDKKNKDRNDKSTYQDMMITHSRPDNPHWFDLCLLCSRDLLCTVALCSAVLYFRVDDEQRVSYLVQLTLRVLIMGTSVALFRLLLEVPVRYGLRRHAVVRRIVPVFNQPLLATCPRDFWHRWSTAVGYHLRGAFYEPFKQQSYAKHNKWLLASVPFGMNAVLHIYWWSWAMTGKTDYSYLVLLVVFPLTTLALQDAIIKVLPEKTSRLRAWLLRIILWIGLASVAETMQVANGAPLALRDVCRSNLLLPKET